jgi:hypothetical protein
MAAKSPGSAKYRRKRFLWHRNISKRKYINNLENGETGRKERNGKYETYLPAVSNQCGILKAVSAMKQKSTAISKCL